MSKQLPVDPVVSMLVRARSRSAVLKHRLIALRGELKDDLIFVFEGVDDKSVYFSWARRVCDNLIYEPFVCKGKKGVLALRGALLRDNNDLRRGVYFFVDRDFDDGPVGIVDLDLFATDRYAIENYLVCERVLEELLKVEFHVDGHPSVRDGIIRAFKLAYANFLQETREINERLFVGRRAGIELRKDLPSRIGEFASVSLDACTLTKTPGEIVDFVREPTVEECKHAMLVFSKLDPVARYRGKFALMFFNKWLDLLAEDRRANNSRFFPALPKNVGINRQAMSLMTLASRSHRPLGFDDFVATAVF